MITLILASVVKFVCSQCRFIRMFYSILWIRVSRPPVFRITLFLAWFRMPRLHHVQGRAAGMRRHSRSPTQTSSMAVPKIFYKERNFLKCLSLSSSCTLVSTWKAPVASISFRISPGMFKALHSTPSPQLLELLGPPSCLPLLPRPHSPALWGLDRWALPSLFRVAQNYPL